MAWVTYKSDIVAVGKKVASFPDHNGQVLEGNIVNMVNVCNEDFIVVDYLHGVGQFSLHKSSGKFSKRYDSSVDVGLIWVEDS